MEDKLNVVLAEITKQIADLAAAHGPAAGDLMLMAVRIGCINQVVCNLIGLVLFGYVAIKAYREAERIRTKEGKALYDCDEDGRMISAYIGTGLFTVLAFMNGGLLASVPLWVGMFEPKFYLAYKIIDKVL